ncbi:DUF5765 domain-containing protein [Rhodobacter ferrooxidans]|uniref:Uncharacterized protein n=1 Tax=Rhodobacter ferrooxidans TaxID=371731 RepID=C8S0X1_9RHOB|nr:DUF5765 domain-containing protein [Rhodobacter sp. SW2]EEW25412.1 hypothetical protein Rsw2DRAFT_1699 [Rhodobacter sp. SW2]
MCWSSGATIAMVAAGAVATAISIRRGDPVAMPLALAYFTFMEALQVGGYMVINQCGSPVNQSLTLLSILHIVFQPLFINAFAMELVPREVKLRVRMAVFIGCALSSVIMLLQLYPFDWAGVCAPGSILCGKILCTVSGVWHQAWDVPYNGLLVPLENLLGTTLGFPSYMIAAFVLPLLYGAWRFALFQFLMGPVLAGQLTTAPNEVPAIWCLFSIGLALVSLSPAIRQRMTVRA